MENNRALVPEVVDDSLPTIADDKLLELAEQAEKRVQAIRTIRNAALLITDVHDWVDERDRPYLQSSGSEKIARVFGISLSLKDPICLDLPGGHYQYKYIGKFELSGSSIEAIGIRASNDSFFTTRYVDKKKTTLPGSEVDRANVEKAAYTNCLGNGITRLLGLRNLTWEDIGEVTKGRITQNKVTTIQYKKKGQPSDTSPKKDAGRKPAKEETTDSGSGEGDRDPNKYISCPEFNGQMVLRVTCKNCKMRENCPSWEEEDKAD